MNNGKEIGKLIAEVHIAHAGANREWYCKLAQRILWDYGPEVVRFGYYNIKADGRVVWGQYATMFNPGELEVLLARAREKGILPF